MAAGVYTIRNVTNGKCYYGSTSDLDRRLNQHWERLNAGTHPNEHLMSAWRLYGEHAFVFETYKVLDSVEEARALEQWILEAHYDKWDQLYNIQRCVNNSVMSEETKQKLSKALKGRKFSDEWKQRISNSLKARPVWNEGLKHSEETRAKISEATQGRVPWNKGIPRTEAERAKMAAAATGKTQSEETKRKKSETLKGRVFSEETRRKISEKRRAYWAARKAAQQTIETGSNLKEK